MRLIDALPYVLTALRTQGPTSQTDLTIMVFGTSGKNSPKLTKSLFPQMVSQGLIQSVKIPGRRGTIYNLTLKGNLALDLAPLDPDESDWFQTFIDDLRRDGDIS